MTIQQKLSLIQQKFKAKKSRFNSFGKYYFRSAEDILEALKPYCKEYKVYFTINEELQMGFAETPIIKSIARIVDNETESGIEASAVVGIDLKQKGMQTPQQFGAASSYAKKYALGNLLLIDDTADSDATNNHGQPAMTDKQFESAKGYVKSGGTIENIKGKYSITAAQEKALITL